MSKQSIERLHEHTTDTVKKELDPYWGGRVLEVNNDLVFFFQANSHLTIGLILDRLTFEPVSGRVPIQLQEKDVHFVTDGEHLISFPRYIYRSSESEFNIKFYARDYGFHTRKTLSFSDSEADFLKIIRWRGRIITVFGIPRGTSREDATCLSLQVH